MEERFGYYGITRRQRTIWTRIIAGSCLIGLALVAVFVIGLFDGEGTLAVVSAPLAVIPIMFAVMMAWTTFHGSPPQGPDVEREIRERSQAASQRTSRFVLWLFTVLGSFFLAWFLIRNIFWSTPDWTAGIMGVIWCSTATFGWWRTAHRRTRPEEPRIRPE